MELLLSRRQSLGCHAPTATCDRELPDRAAMLDTLGVPDFMPFILGDDGCYDLRLNAFLRELPALGVPAEQSWLAYGRDLLTWARFLAEQRAKSVWDADQADVVAYHHARRLGPPETVVESSTWDRGIATLDKFYGWAIKRGYVAASPFFYRPARSRAAYGRHGDAPVNLAKERRGRRRPPGFVSVADYLVFRDVGLRGRLPDGGADPAWKGRNGERNAVFAELLVTTGMRLEEASTLLWPEIPAAGGGKSQPLPVCAEVAKRGRARTVRVPNRVLSAVGTYLSIERANVVSHTSSRPGDDGEIFAWDARGAVVQRDGRRVRVPFAKMTARTRRRLWRLDDTGRREPLVIWLAEGGRPVGDRAWEAVFKRACLRCGTFGATLDVTPHTRRHTFAVHMLSMLIREQIGSLAVPRPDGGGAAYRRIVGDPLQRLQRLLGHASITSTYIYLDTVSEAQFLVDDAIDRWAAEIENETSRSRD